MLKITTILLLAFIVRMLGINWDQGLHLHPDERMLIMVAEKIHFFQNLNPNFFNYGTLPIYVLKAFAQISDYVLFTHFANYNGLLYLGRFLSTIADVGVVFLVYKIAQLLFTFRAKPNNNLTLLAASLYAIVFFPIQNSHFFIVDTFLTLFLTALLYFLLRYWLNPTMRNIFYISLTMAAALATKITAVLFLPVVIAVILSPLLRQKNTSPLRGTPLTKRRIILTTFYFLLTTTVLHFLFMPYAYIEYQRFISDILLQSKMSSDPYIFPYTLQYVTTFPYLYYLQNIFIWGLGPVISGFALLGVIAASIKIYRKKLSPIFIITFSFYALYFLIIGKSAVKFMRYMLPLYPLFILLATDGIHQVEHYVANKLLRKKYSPRLNKALLIAPAVVAALWTFPFLLIYTKPHTRIAASEWINKNIPYGSPIAVEHWDDRLPIAGSEKYRIVELTLYDTPDFEEKWTVLDEKLSQAEYIIIASNRLYTPLQKLSDCTVYKRCYPRTTQYYQQLLNNNLVVGSGTKQSHFKKVAEFTAYPGLNIGPPVGGWKLEIKDDSADESFTVYDHPKIMIFKKRGGE